MLTEVSWGRVAMSIKQGIGQGRLILLCRFCHATCDRNVRVGSAVGVGEYVTCLQNCEVLIRGTGSAIDVQVSALTVQLTSASLQLRSLQQDTTSLGHPPHMPPATTEAASCRQKCARHKHCAIKPLRHSGSLVRFPHVSRRDECLVSLYGSAPWVRPAQASPG